MNDDEEVGRSTKLTISQRVGLLERDVRAHASSLTMFVEHNDGLSARVTNLEEWRTTRQIAEAREDERDKSLYERLSRIERLITSSIDEVNNKINRITGFGSRIFWIAMGTIIPAVVLIVAIAIVFGVRIVPPLGDVK